jgi:hypothetical protein
MTGRDAASAIVFLGVVWCLALAIWPVSILRRFEFWAPHAERIQTSAATLRFWRAFYGLCAGFFLAGALIVEFATPSE